MVVRVLPAILLYGKGLSSRLKSSYTRSGRECRLIVAVQRRGTDEVEKTWQGDKKERKNERKEGRTAWTTRSGERRPNKNTNRNKEGFAFDKRRKKKRRVRSLRARVRELYSRPTSACSILWKYLVCRSSSRTYTARRGDPPEIETRGVAFER